MNLFPEKAESSFESSSSFSKIHFPQYKLEPTPEPSDEEEDSSEEEEEAFGGGKKKKEEEDPAASEQISFWERCKKLMQKGNMLHLEWGGEVTKRFNTKGGGGGGGRPKV